MNDKANAVRLPTPSGFAVDQVGVPPQASEDDRASVHDVPDVANSFECQRRMNTEAPVATAELERLSLKAVSPVTCKIRLTKMRPLTSY